MYVECKETPVSVHFQQRTYLTVGRQQGGEGGPREGSVVILRCGEFQRGNLPPPQPNPQFVPLMMRQWESKLPF